MYSLTIHHKLHPFECPPCLLVWLTDYLNGCIQNTKSGNKSDHKFQLMILAYFKVLSFLFFILPLISDLHSSSSDSLITLQTIFPCYPVSIADNLDSLSLILQNNLSFSRQIGLSLFPSDWSGCVLSLYRSAFPNDFCTFVMSFSPESGQPGTMDPSILQTPNILDCVQNWHPSFKMRKSS